MQHWLNNRNNTSQLSSGRQASQTLRLLTLSFLEDGAPLTGTALTCAAMAWRYCRRCECTGHQRSPQLPPGDSMTTPSRPIACIIFLMLHFGKCFSACELRPGSCACAHTYLTALWKVGTSRAAAAHSIASPRLLWSATS